MTIEQSRYNSLKPPIIPKWKVTTDLHLHTSMSDGNLTPDGLIKSLYNTKLTTISITDHDTTDGINEATKTAVKKNISVIPGVEISTSFESNEIHLLGYFINISNKMLQRKLEDLRKGRIQSIKKIITKLSSIGYKIEVEEVMRLSKSSVGRPHIAKVMVTKGYVSNTTEAFEQILSQKNIINIQKKKIGTLEALKVIHKAGGISVIGHPRTVKNLEQHLPTLTDHGLNGMEVYAEKYDADMIKHYKKLCVAYGLVSSGGSDYHARNEPNEIKPGITGPPPSVPYEMFDRAKRLHGKNIGSIPLGF